MISMPDLENTAYLFHGAEKSRNLLSTVIINSVL
jgi:hypothetical protein